MLSICHITDVTFLLQTCIARNDASKAKTQWANVKSFGFIPSTVGSQMHSSRSRRLRQQQSFKNPDSVNTFSTLGQLPSIYMSFLPVVLEPTLFWGSLLKPLERHQMIPQGVCGDINPVMHGCTVEHVTRLCNTLNSSLRMPCKPYNYTSNFLPASVC